VTLLTTGGLETELGFVLEEVERQIEDVRGLERD